MHDQRVTKEEGTLYPPKCFSHLTLITLPPPHFGKHRLCCGANWETSDCLDEPAAFSNWLWVCRPSVASWHTCVYCICTYTKVNTFDNQQKWWRGSHLTDVSDFLSLSFVLSVTNTSPPCKWTDLALQLSCKLPYLTCWHEAIYTEAVDSFWRRRPVGGVRRLFVALWHSCCLSSLSSEWEITTSWDSPP